ncbi:AMP-binding protein [Metapseudomonas otitidis]|uniref:AMP-binding protein n=1 Tax=Metapseudomonas otitidis TaxID=319939 RepID=A0ABU3XJC1_9GAMM|nr:AMP-binding protein [Pseudomonas otitidis]MCO7556076.1 AMP-binding protein [Pseudomonas otitidis]MDV3438041.1 AMP-binding protein [Pseudomonas otitidis]MEE1896298.1 AMP-binding protein [Pseudomonas otitidis]WMR32202.1 AMP-binding protein [Pseudomonas otitidis]SFA65528.1 Long-chain acyl-CoA synthetase (AMP-forming) [Pseudomonas otitidis]
MADAVRLPLDMFFEREARHPNKRYLVQPMAGGQVEELTWGDVGDQARRAASWLRGRDLPPGSRIAIISKNCAHWIVADLAIWMAGHVSVPLYPNLTGESVRQVLEHSESALAFIGKLDDWPAMSGGIPEGVATIALPIHPEGTFDYAWSDLLDSTPIRDNPRTRPEQLATIIYTSGTTGTPKGVMQSFGNFAFAAEHGVQLFNTGESDRLLSYLPLCHVAERMFVEMASLYAGQTVFFAESLDTFLRDLRRARPTAIFGVPRIWTKFQMGVFEKMPAQKLDRLLRLPLIGRFIGRKVLAGLGLDAVRVALCGAAPVPEALLHWYKRLGLDVLEVYGMTENCGYSHVCRPGEQKTGWIGRNSPGVEVRISEEGEVQVRSGATMQGYYKDPERTAETITPDGFLRTGDKGEQDADGNLRLTGRIKEIFKTSKGKYVAPAPIENRLAVHTRIEQVCVVGDGLPQPMALCVLSEVGRQEAGNGTREQLEGSLRALLDEVNQALDKHERLLGLVLVKDVWAVDNGFLTPTLKIKRNVVEGTYGPRFPEWIERRETVLWHD